MTLINFISSFTVNTILHALYLPLSAQQLWKNFKNSCKSGKDLFKLIWSTLFGTAGGLASSAISYENTLFLGKIPALVLSVISFLTNFSTRSVGSGKFLDRFLNFFNKDVLTQKAGIDTLQHLKKDYIPLVEAAIQERVTQKDPKCSQAEFLKQLMDTILDTLENLKNEQNLTNKDLFKEATCTEGVSNKAANVGILMLASAVMIAAFLTFMEKGFQGADITVELGSDHKNNLEGLDIWWKRVIGLVPGLGGAMLFFTSMIDLWQVVGNMATYLSNHRDSKKEVAKNTALVTALLTVNYFASDSMRDVATTILKNPNNIMPPMPPKLGNTITAGTYGAIFERLDQLGGAAVNSTACFRQAFLKNMPNPSYGDILKYYANANDNQLFETTSTVSARGHANDARLFTLAEKTVFDKFKAMTMKTSDTDSNPDTSAFIISNAV